MAEDKYTFIIFQKSNDEKNLEEGLPDSLCKGLE